MRVNCEKSMPCNYLTLFLFVFIFKFQLQKLKKKSQNGVENS